MTPFLAFVVAAAALVVVEGPVAPQLDGAVGVAPGTPASPEAAR